MCFANDNYDWVVADWEEHEIVSSGKIECDDCGQLIPIGENCLQFEGWEYEQCYECGLRHPYDCTSVRCFSLVHCLDDDDEPITKDTGEDCIGHRCQTCIKLREAIKEYELGRGCKEYHALPIEPLREHYDGMGPEDFSDYVEYACGKFPEMAEEFRSRFPVTYE